VKVASAERQVTYFESENPHSGLKVEDLVPDVCDKRLCCATSVLRRRELMNVFSFCQDTKGV